MFAPKRDDWQKKYTLLSYQYDISQFTHNRKGLCKHIIRVIIIAYLAVLTLLQQYFIDIEYNKCSLLFFLTDQIVRTEPCNKYFLPTYNRVTYCKLMLCLL